MFRPPSASNPCLKPKTNSTFSGTCRPRSKRLAGETVRRVVGLLAFFALITAVFYTGTSSATATHKGATENSLAVPRRSAAGYNPGMGLLLPPAMFQLQAETVTTYAADCSTPKSDFNLGETVCARATFASSIFPFRFLTWVDTDNNILDAAIFTSSGQTDLFTLPGSPTSIIGGNIVDNRGTWRVDLRDAEGSRPATAAFDVHDPANLRADLQISVTNGGNSVESGATVPATIVVYNAGPDAATNVGVTAPSVAGLSLQSFHQGAGPDCGSTCTLASLSPGGRAVFLATYSVTAAAGTLVEAEATVTSETTDPRPSNNSAAFAFLVSTPSGNPTCTLDCPGPITVNGSEQPDPNDPSSTLYGAIVTYGVDAVGDSCAPIQCDTPSGSLFPVGATGVTCFAPTGDSCSFVVTVVDTRSLQINLIGANPLAIECNSVPPFADPGATTNRPGITPTASSAVNPNAPGTYTITYTATDGTNTATATRTVNVVDDSPPQITLNGDDPLTVEVETGELTIECHTAFTDPGATANDACDGLVPVSVNSNVNPNVPGTYTITYTATDEQGTPGDSSDDLIATATRTINVVDTTDPAITLNGATTLTVECHTAFADPGATASDACAGNLTPAIQVSGTVDPNTVGTYTRTYTVSDAAGNDATVARTVNVVDRTAPVININGNSPATVECHTSYTDAGATANDACNGPVPVTASGSVNVNTPGTYTITYTATDGTNTATAKRTVKVVDTIRPVITRNGAAAVTVECHTAFADPGATASDSCAGSVPVTSSGVVNTNAPGTYTITYAAIDPSGNAALPVTRTVTVVDTTLPTITLNGQTITLSPPNHSYHTISVTGLVTSAADSCDAGVDRNDVLITQVSSDEVENSNGDGNTSNDIVIAPDCKSVQLRAERSGNGNGRVYTITLRVRDATGNTRTATAKVMVPKNQGNNGGAVDDGPAYTVNGSCP